MAHADPRTSNWAWIYYILKKNPHLYQTTIYRFQPETGIIQNLERLPTDTWFDSLSADKKWLIFHDESNAIYRLSINGTRWDEIAPAIQADTNSAYIRGYGEADDWFYFSLAQGDVAGDKLYRVHILNKTLQYLTSMGIGDTYYFTPDKTWLVSTNFASETQIWHGFHIPTGQHYNDITAPLAPYTELVFSADQQSIYFTSVNDKHDKFQLYRMPLSNTISTATALSPVMANDITFLRESANRQWIYYLAPYYIRDKIMGRIFFNILYRVPSDPTPSTASYAVLLDSQFYRYTSIFNGTQLMFVRENQATSLYDIYWLDTNSGQIEFISTGVIDYQWVAASEFFIMYKDDTFILVDSSGQWYYFPAEIVSRLSIISLTDNLLLYRDGLDTYQINILTGQRLKFPINEDFAEFSYRIPMPIHPMPTNALVAGFAMLSTSLIFAYKFRGRGH